MRGGVCTSEKEMASVPLEVADSPAVPSCAFLQSSAPIRGSFWGLLAQQKAVHGFEEKGVYFHDQQGHLQLWEPTDLLIVLVLTCLFKMLFVCIICLYK